jgi:hypothetical protein
VTGAFLIALGGIAILLASLGPIRAITFVKLRTLAGTDVVFTVANRPEFADALSLGAVGTELGDRAAVFTSEPLVSADEIGLSFWDNNPITLVGSIPWNVISSIEAGDVRTRYRRITSHAISVDVAFGRAVIRVPLLSPNAGRSPIGSRGDVDWIVTELRRRWLASR